MKRFLLVATALLSIATSAQNKVHLKSGTYEVPEGAFLQLNQQKATYGIAMWDHAVAVEDKKALADLGVKLFHYLPSNAFEVRIPKGVSREQLQSAGLSAFTAWTPRMKLDRPLSNMDIPSWAIVDGGQLAVQFLVNEEFNSIPSFVKQAQFLGDDWYTGIVKPSSLERLASNPGVLYIQAIEEPGTPENLNSRAASRVAYAQRNGTYDGTGVVVSVGDDGDIGPHADYKGRLTSLAGNSIGNHGDHVSGTVFGAGNIDPDAEGNAPGSTMIYYDYPGNLTNIDTHYGLYGIRVTNSSYSNGCNAGYTAFAQAMDKDIRDHAALMHVFSAGNSNGSNCGYGAGSQWGNVTGGHKQGKNVVATANITSLDAIAGSSSRGPAADGRIKPDLAAVGTQVYSTYAGNIYASITGTSMAAPGVAGFFSVLHSAFDDLQQDTATGGLLKAIAMNTADDLGNDGPDFIYGYGRVNARRAIRTIRDTAWFTGTATTGDTASYVVNLPQGVEEFRAMLYWTDPEGSLTAAQALVNNLDFEVEDLTNQASYLPWRLNHAPNATTLNNLAVRGVDTINNAEQVTLANPTQGDYRMYVYGTNVPTGPQTYYVVYDYEVEEVALTFPHTGASLEPGTMVVRWDGETAGLTWELSTDHGSTWSTVGLTSILNQGMANWPVPNTPTDGAYLRVISGGGDTSTAGPMTIMEQPTGLTVDWVCPDSVKITINPVSSANTYTAYILGTMYMDSVYTDSSNSMVIPYVPSTDTWISASANINGGHGKRAYAIELPAGTSSCPLPRDARLSEIVNPQFVSSCQNSMITVAVEIYNPSTSILDTVPVAYEFNNTVVRDTLFASLAPYADSIFLFGTPIAWTGTSNSSISAWTELSGDQNGLNDTLVQTIDYLNSTMYALPFTQTFDSFSSCPTATNCGGTVCNLGGNWQNLTNGTSDDIDWRTNQGGTTSAGTGPTSGFGGSGKYLYLEASNGCEGQEALLYSPCIDLGGAIAPELEFAYHMFGPNTGDLEVEVFNGIQWTPVLNVAGNQGNSWRTAVVDLSAYAGDTVVIRVSGITGDGYQSDMAIDNFAIEDKIGIPEADFTASTPTPCLNTAITLFDASQKSPTSWSWSISPSTFTFVNGTSSTSQNPQVSFSALGTYDITLVASNSFGSDTIVKTNEIVLSVLPKLPLVETFTANNFGDFTLINPDGGTTWVRGDVDGSTGAKTGAAYMGYFNYSTTGESDALLSPKFDISGYTQPTLMFDLSYAPYSTQFFDELAVLVSSDCGSTFDTLYLKGGTDLATAAPQTSLFIPGPPSDWRTDSVDLSNLNSDFIQFQIVGICGYGNNLYLDNIRVIDIAGTPSAASLVLPAICEDESFNFSIASTDTTLDGNVTVNRQGSSLTSTFFGMGPHTFTLTSSVDYLFEYVYYNEYTFVADSGLAIPGPQLSPAFQLAGAGNLSYNFTDATTPTPTAWMWDFGDGGTSTAQNPTHTFATGGSYTVKLVVTTDCGVDSVLTNFSNIGVDENGLQEVLFYPNPTSNVLNVDLGAERGEADVLIYDMLGALISESHFPESNQVLTVDLSNLPSGIYNVVARTQGRSSSQTVSKL